ncbi:hypothetical protein BDZ89DRAFT_1210101 [Hymenopellis radicata]|nr:hypothetical protein BDZ89DRAFT_1210101 [Hymenopellis radicata]
MFRVPAFLFLLCLPSLSYALDIRSLLFFWRRADRSVPEAGYYNPYESERGGSLLTNILGTTYPPGQAEPVNAIISGNSDEQMLKDQEENGGLRTTFCTSLQFSGECLGQHQGTAQQVDLGDGNGYLNETAVIRYNYGDPALGSCTETIKGGNHFRYWVQNGDGGNSGAIFMACSYEMPISLQHDIVPNGYNLGRDYIVGNITGSVIPTLTLTNESTYSGSTSYGGYTYKTDVSYASGMLQNTSIGINHNLTVLIDGVTNAVDGLVAVLQVTITERPQSDQNAALSVSPWPSLCSTIVFFAALLLSFS